MMCALTATGKPTKFSVNSLGFDGPRSPPYVHLHLRRLPGYRSENSRSVPSHYTTSAQHAYVTHIKHPALLPRSSDASEISNSRSETLRKQTIF